MTATPATFRADNTDGRIPARDFASLAEVPTGVGYNRVTVVETGETWVRYAFADCHAQWGRTVSAKVA